MAQAKQFIKWYIDNGAPFPELEDAVEAFEDHEDAKSTWGEPYRRYFRTTDGASDTQFVSWRPY